MDADIQPFDAPIIALHGAAGVGKSVVAQRMTGFRKLRLSFADPIKEFLQIVFGLDSMQLWGPSYRRRAHIHLSAQEWEAARMRFNAYSYDWVSSVAVHRHLALVDWFEAMEDHYYRAGYKNDAAAFSARFLCRSLAEDWGCSYEPEAWVRVMARRIHRRLSTNRFGPATTDLIVIDDARKTCELRALHQWGAGIIAVRPSKLPEPDLHPSEAQVYSMEAQALCHGALIIDDPAELRVEQDWRYEELDGKTSRQDADRRDALVSRIETLAALGLRRCYAGQCEAWLRA